MQTPSPDRPVYLDNAATTPLAPEVLEAMRPWLEERYGNPSSRHPLGVRAAERIDDVRWSIARALGAEAERVAFTSGGTEANNLAVIGLARAAGKGHVLVGATEHACVRLSAAALAEEGFEVETLPLEPGGALDPDRAASHVRDDTVLVAVMAVNNEFGSIYPVRDLARRVRARSARALVHVDAVQALGKVPVSLGELEVDSLSISAHKVHGPKGSGALALGERAKPRPLLFGGGQEAGLRSGTENVAGISGLGASVEHAVARREELFDLGRTCRAALTEAIADLRGARVLEPDGGAGVVPTIAAVLVPGAPAEVLLHHLEVRGVLVGAGSACQARSSALSPGLIALGLDEDQARRVLRFSFSLGTDPEAVRAAGAALVEVARSVEPASR
jgi:cysteine desulfurase